ncbi:MOSC domain-containing protein [Mesorhizobium sp. CGMCC 1.15528]|uniref:MOSC domain-containing protein n=1 Tax=Mesorhizobium zhangyense TaxID=1776730 RepID=A0A7C9VA32_9HYPH|nr:MOSC N-terminal beta barrel domain-containing protein [Mesorhizobium zhangyense]NGN40250.1 MOSC domain-containing protein [Mesorhizobium zhangyense]
MTAVPFRVESLHIYPLKSGAGLSVETARLEPEGLVGDRRMMVVDEEGNCITARKTSKLMQVRTHLDGDEVVLTAPGMPVLAFARDTLHRTDTVTIWGDSVIALDAGDAASQWLQDFLGRPCRLVVKGGQTRRPLGLGGGGTVSFADTAPLLLTNAASLANMNRFLETEAEMQRFRPNLVVSGPDAYAEDSWATVRIGEIEFEVAGACDRCVMITLDPRTGEGRPDHEPLALLGKQRRGEDGKAYFGQFLIPRTMGRLTVGDPVEVLARKVPITILPGSAVPVTRLPLTTGATGGASNARGRERLLRCVAVIDETHDFRTFRFQLEPGEAIDYKPGQFITLLLDIDGQTVRRNYTISSSPSRPHHVSVTVKRVEGGRISNWLHDTLKPGDTLRSLGPNGRFHLATAGSVERLLLLSAGSGITPMMSMLRFIADANLPLDIHFHHSARNAEDVSFLHELALLRRQMGGRLRLSWNLTGVDAAQEMLASTRFGEDSRPNVLSGRLDEGVLRAACPDLAERLVFCCGPDGFRSKARQIYEDWQPTPKHPFLEETFGPDRSAAPEAEIGTYTVSFLKSGKSVEGEGAVTVLELARKAGVELPADCEAGICGTCRCKVVSGEWRIAPNAADPERAALSDEEKQSGYILACSTNPVGAVELDI